MTHSLPQLEAMEPRELDAVVAEVVMGYRWYDCTNAVDYSRCSRLMPPGEAVPKWHTLVERPLHAIVSIPRRYSDSWNAFGHLLNRMAELGYRWSLHYSRFSPDQGYVNIASFQHTDWPSRIPLIPETQYPLNAEQAKASPSLPRAAAIASVLAVQGVEG